MRSVRVGATAVMVGLLMGLGAQLGSAASLGLSSQALTPYRTCTLTASPAITAIAADATVLQGLPFINFGSTTTLEVSSGTGVNQRTYLQFDLQACSPGIPSTAIVRLATLRLHVAALPSACRTVELFPVTSTWSEGTITWSNQPFGTAINQPPSASGHGILRRRRANGLPEPDDRRLHRWGHRDR